MSQCQYAWALSLSLDIFDYLDDVFQKDISKEFEELLEEAQKIPEEDPKKFDDPYTAEKLLFYWSHGVEGRDPVKGNGKPVVVDPKRLVQYKRDFDPELWSKSFSAAKISNIIKESLKTPDIKNVPSENSLSIPLKEARENFEKEYLTTQLKKFNGNISKTADFIGMERSALHRKLKGLGIKELN
mgnify:CR=1 FL=1